MAMLNYRGIVELNKRFQRSWQSDVSPLGHGGRFAVESYLDFHGNKFDAPLRREQLHPPCRGHGLARHRA